MVPLTEMPYGLRIVLIVLFLALHGVVAIADAQCCVGEANERHDIGQDVAEADHIAKAKACPLFPPWRTASCLEKVHERYEDAQAECRRVRDQEISDCFL